jgi:spore germination protein YaaH
MSQQKVVLDERGTFDRKRIVDLHNKVVKMFNENHMKTYWCVVMRTNGKQKGEWVNIKAIHPETINRIVVFEYDQKPVFITSI